MQHIHQLNIDRVKFEKTISLIIVKDYNFRLFQKGDVLTFNNCDQEKYELVEIINFGFISGLDAKSINIEKSYKFLILANEKIFCTVKVRKLLPEEDTPKVYRASKSATRKHSSFLAIMKKAYDSTCILCQTYPSYFNWFWEKVVPTVLNGKRDLLVATKGKKVVGVLVFTYPKDTFSIDLLYVIPEFRQQGIATLLLETCFSIIKTKKPLIAISPLQLSQFDGIIKKYHWDLTQLLNTENFSTSRCVIFNGIIKQQKAQ